ncbi:MAG: SAM hydroxide adenosyltransferase [Verrucomicrobiota bacterium]
MNCLVIATLALAFPLLLSAQKHLTGTIDGADFIVDVPAEPSGNVMFIARGFRPDFFPVSPVYEVETDFYQTLLKEGWTIASTAFQSNDWVVAAGAEDILKLQAHIEAEIHPIRRAFVYGETMGGGVAVWLAENKAETFAGVLCLGAHLFPEPVQGQEISPTITDAFSLKPKLPIVFLANGAEMLSSQTYANQVAKTSVTPITWFIDRSGHVNVNSAERLAAMRALVGWSEGAAIAAVENGTITMNPNSTATLSGSAAAGAIRRLRPLYGNIYTSFVREDLESIGIQIGDTFLLSHRKQTHEITFAKAYSDVPYHAWVAFIDPEGYVQVSRNYANAAETIGAVKGDSLLFSKPSQQ